MGWAVGYDTNWQRDIGYGVPALCDQPGCGAKIDRGLSYVCGSELMGGEHGCGLYFCEGHLVYSNVDPAADEFDDDFDEDAAEYAELCEGCGKGEQPFDPTPDLDEWTQHKMTDPSWAQWRETAGAV